MRNYLPTELQTSLTGHPPRKSATYQRRLAQTRNSGQPAVQACPHALTTWDQIEDPTRPGRVITRRTINHCQLTDRHYRAEIKGEQQEHRSGRLTW